MKNGEWLDYWQRDTLFGVPVMTGFRRYTGQLICRPREWTNNGWVGLAPEWPATSAVGPRVKLRLGPPGPGESPVESHQRWKNASSLPHLVASASTT